MAANRFAVVFFRPRLAERTPYNPGRVSSKGHVFGAYPPASVAEDCSRWD